jgi:hypothetical protein
VAARHFIITPSLAHRSSEHCARPDDDLALVAGALPFVGCEARSSVALLRPRVLHGALSRTLKNFGYAPVQRAARVVSRSAGHHGHDPLG